MCVSNDAVHVLCERRKVMMDEEGSQIKQRQGEREILQQHLMERGCTGKARHRRRDPSSRPPHFQTPMPSFTVGSELSF